MALFLFQKSIAQERVRRAGCLNNLQQIGQAIDAYRREHTGKYPASIGELYPKYLSDRRILICRLLKLPVLSSCYQRCLCAYSHPRQTGRPLRAR